MMQGEEDTNMADKTTEKPEGLIEGALRKAGMLPIKEACERVGVSQNTVIGTYASKGKMGPQTEKINGRWWTTLEAVEKIKPQIEANRERPSVQKMRGAGTTPHARGEDEMSLVNVLRSREGQAAIGDAVMAVVSNAAVARIIADQVVTLLVEGDMANRVPSLRDIVREAVKEAVG